ncbi:unnamed protein product [Urochloa humidicola]
MLSSETEAVQDALESGGWRLPTTASRTRSTTAGSSIRSPAPAPSRCGPVTVTPESSLAPSSLSASRMTAVAMAAASSSTYRYHVAAPDGRLMAVTKRSKEVQQGPWHRKVTRVFFTVMVLDEARRRWEEAENIGSSELFLGVNASVCVPVALEYRGIRPNCIYFTDHQVVEAYLCNEHDREDSNELREVGVYSLKRRKVEEIVGLGKHPRWPPPAWFTPSFL